MRIGHLLPLVAIPLAAQTPPQLVRDSAWSVSATRGEAAASFTIHSAVLGQTRRVNVTLPPVYATAPSSRRFPVVVVLDGEADLAPTAAVADELTRNGQMPDAILVAIENTDAFNGRVHDLTPPGLLVTGGTGHDGGDAFLDFIEQELLPAVDRQFRGALPRTLIGHSSGAILATWAAATRPTYRAVISIDAPIALQENWLAGKLKARAAAAPPPLRYVSYEAKFGWPDDEWKALLAAAPPTWSLRRESLRLEGHETIYMLGAYLGLREVFADYSRLAAQDRTPATVLDYYASVGKAFGAPLVPPRRVLADATDALIGQGRATEARKAYDALAAGYGAPTDSARLIAEIAEAARRPAPTETVESLLATPLPTAAEARAFIGDWVGSQWMQPDAPRANTITLRVRVEAGKVIAELLNPAAPPEMRTRKVDYLRVTSAGLTYGFVNGMQPRGVAMWEGTLRGDTLSGKQRWGGVTFAYPPEAHLDPGFRFVRVRK